MSRPPAQRSSPADRGYRPRMIGAILLGLVAGFIGKLLMPGKDPGGFIATIALAR